MNSANNRDLNNLQSRHTEDNPEQNPNSQTDREHIIKAPFYFMQNLKDEIEFETKPSLEISVENAEDAGYDYILELEGEMDFRVAVSHYAPEEHRYLPTASAFRITRAQPTANFERGYGNCDNADIRDPRYDNYVYTPANLSNPDNQMMYNLATGVNFTGPDMDERRDIKLQLSNNANFTDTVDESNDYRHRWSNIHSDATNLQLKTLQYRGSRYTKDTGGTYVHNRKRVGLKNSTPIDVPEEYKNRTDEWIDENGAVTAGRQIIVHYQQMAASLSEPDNWLNKHNINIMDSYAIQDEPEDNSPNGSISRGSRHLIRDSLENGDSTDYDDTNRVFIQNTTQALIYNEQNEDPLQFTAAVPKKTNLFLDTAAGNYNDYNNDIIATIHSSQDPAGETMEASRKINLLSNFRHDSSNFVDKRSTDGETLVKNFANTYFFQFLDSIDPSGSIIYNNRDTKKVAYNLIRDIELQIKDLMVNDADLLLSLAETSRNENTNPVEDLFYKTGATPGHYLQTRRVTDIKLYSQKMDQDTFSGCKAKTYRTLSGLQSTTFSQACTPKLDENGNIVNLRGMSAMPAVSASDKEKGWLNGKRPEGGFSFILRTDNNGDLTDFTAVTALNYEEYLENVYSVSEKSKKMFRTSDETLYFPQDDRKYYTNQFSRVGDVFTVHHTADHMMKGNNAEASGSSFDIVVLSVIQPDIGVNTAQTTNVDKSRVTPWKPYVNENSVIYERQDIFWEDEYKDGNGVHRKLDTYGWGTLWGHDKIDGKTEEIVDAATFVTNGYRNPQNDKTLCGYPNKVAILKYDENNNPKVIYSMLESSDGDHPTEITFEFKTPELNVWTESISNLELRFFVNDQLQTFEEKNDLDVLELIMRKPDISAAELNQLNRQHSDVKDSLKAVSRSTYQKVPSDFSMNPDGIFDGEAGSDQWYFNLYNKTGSLYSGWNEVDCSDSGNSPNNCYPSLIANPNNGNFAYPQNGADVLGDGVQNSKATMYAFVEAKGKLSFDYQYSSEEGYDGFVFQVKNLKGDTLGILLESGDGTNQYDLGNYSGLSAEDASMIKRFDDIVAVETYGEDLNDFGDTLKWTAHIDLDNFAGEGGLILEWSYEKDDTDLDVSDDTVTLDNFVATNMAEIPEPSDMLRDAFLTTVGLDEQPSNNISIINSGHNLFQNNGYRFDGQAWNKGILDLPWPHIQKDKALYYQIIEDLVHNTRSFQVPYGPRNTREAIKNSAKYTISGVRANLIHSIDENLDSEQDIHTLLSSNWENKDYQEDANGYMWSYDRLLSRLAPGSGGNANKPVLRKISVDSGHLDAYTHRKSDTNEADNEAKDNSNEFGNLPALENWYYGDTYWFRSSHATAQLSSINFQWTSNISRQTSFKDGERSRTAKFSKNGILVAAIRTEFHDSSDTFADGLDKGSEASSGYVSNYLKKRINYTRLKNNRPPKSKEFTDSTDISHFKRENPANDPNPDGKVDGFAEHFNYECYNLYTLSKNVPQKINDKNLRSLYAENSKTYSPLNYGHTNALMRFNVDHNGKVIYDNIDEHDGKELNPNRLDKVENTTEHGKKYNLDVTHATTRSHRDNTGDKDTDTFPDYNDATTSNSSDLSVKDLKSNTFIHIPDLRTSLFKNGSTSEFYLEGDIITEKLTGLQFKVEKSSELIVDTTIKADDTNTAAVHDRHFTAYNTDTKLSDLSATQLYGNKVNYEAVAFRQRLQKITVDLYSKFNLVSALDDLDISRDEPLEGAGHKNALVYPNLRNTIGIQDVIVKYNDILEEVGGNSQGNPEGDEFLEGSKPTDLGMKHTFELKEGNLLDPVTSKTVRTYSQIIINLTDPEMRNLNMRIPDIEFSNLKHFTEGDNNGGNFTNVNHSDGGKFVNNTGKGYSYQNGERTQATGNLQVSEKSIVVDNNISGEQQDLEEPLSYATTNVTLDKTGIERTNDSIALIIDLEAEGGTQSVEVTPFTGADVAPDYTYPRHTAESTHKYPFVEEGESVYDHPYYAQVDTTTRRGIGENGTTLLDAAMVQTHVHYINTVSCPNSNERLDVNGSCVSLSTICNKGDYLSTNDAEEIVCVSCPEGSYCPEINTQSPKKCPEGSVAKGTGNSECEKCILGETFENLGNLSEECEAVTPCSAGNYIETAATLTSDQTCDACPVGNYCPDVNTESPKTCEAYHISAEGSTECTYCGSDFIAMDNVCKECGAGEIPRVLDDETQECVSCDELGTGDYWEDEDKQSCHACYDCAANNRNVIEGSECGDNNDASCGSCITGYTEASATDNCVGSACNTCTPVTCNKNQYVDNGECKECVAGTYEDTPQNAWEGDTTCTEALCPEGTAGDKVVDDCTTIAGYLGSVVAAQNDVGYTSTLEKAVCPANTTGNDVLSGCTPITGYTGSVTAAQNEKGYTSDVGKAECPTGTTGDYVLSVCTTDAGYLGSVTAAQNEKGYTSDVTAVACPAETTTGTDIVDGCTPKAGYIGEIKAEANTHGYTSTVELATCPVNTTGNNVVEGCTPNPGYTGVVTAVLMSVNSNAYTSTVAPADCPANTTGNNVVEGCAPNPGYNGEVTAVLMSVNPNAYTSTVELNAVEIPPHVPHDDEDPTDDHTEDHSDVFTKEQMEGNYLAQILRARQPSKLYTHLEEISKCNNSVASGGEASYLGAEEGNKTKAKYGTNKPQWGDDGLECLECGSLEECKNTEDGGCCPSTTSWKELLGDNGDLESYITNDSGSPAFVGAVCPITSENCGSMLPILEASPSVFEYFTTAGALISTVEELASCPHCIGPNYSKVREIKLEQPITQRSGSTTLLNEIKSADKKLQKYLAEKLKQRHANDNHPLKDLDGNLSKKFIVAEYNKNIVGFEPLVVEGDKVKFENAVLSIFTKTYLGEHRSYDNNLPNASKIQNTVVFEGPTYCEQGAAAWEYLIGNGACVPHKIAIGTPNPSDAVIQAYNDCVLKASTSQVTLHEVIIHQASDVADQEHAEIILGIQLYTTVLPDKSFPNAETIFRDTEAGNITDYTVGTYMETLTR